MWYVFNEENMWGNVNENERCKTCKTGGSRSNIDRVVKC
jgi:hypothetical protein